MNSSWPTPSSARVLALRAVALSALLMAGCQGPGYDDPDEVLTPGTISFPFSYQPESIGKEGRHGNKLVVKSIAGQREYVIELPDEGDNYDIEVPAASFGQQAKNPYKAFKNPSATDRELVDQMPQLSADAYRQRQQIEEGLGLTEKGGPAQSPSYIMGLAEINDLYRKGDLELALVKTNNLIIHYPTSAKLHKMKGTLLIKLRNYPLAQRAWVQAARLDPSDKLLQRGLSRLENRIENERRSSISAPPAANVKPAANVQPAVPEQPAPAPAPTPVPAAEPTPAPNPLPATSNTGQGMTPKGFSDGLAPKNVPDDTRNSLRNAASERAGNTANAANNANSGGNGFEMNEEGLANGNLAENLSADFNNNTKQQEQQQEDLPRSPNTEGNGLFNGDPDADAEQEGGTKPPNVWRNPANGNAGASGG